MEWLTLRGENGKGLKVVAKDKIVFAVWLFSEQNLSTANFTLELEDAEYFTINIYLIQPGVGGIDSWSIKARPLEQYRLLEKNYSDGFNITPYSLDPRERSNSPLNEPVTRRLGPKAIFYLAVITSSYLTDK